MPREVISTPHAPEYASYSQAVKAGNTDRPDSRHGLGPAQRHIASRSGTAEVSPPAGPLLPVPGELLPAAGRLGGDGGEAMAAG